MPRDPIVFDFDLTLADSTEGFLDAYHHTAQHFGVPTPPRDAILSTIGTPLPIAVPRLIGSAVAADDFIRVYQQRADEMMNGLTVMLPGAEAAVRALAAAGYPIAIVSQKLRYRVEAVLQREGLLDAFAFILGAEDVPAFKPDPRGLLQALDRLGGQPGHGLFVGDTEIDAETGRNAGVPFVAVLTGVTSAEAFAPYAPLAVLPSVRDLPAFLDATVPAAPEPR